MLELCNYFIIFKNNSQIILNSIKVTNNFSMCYIESELILGY